MALQTMGWKVDSAGVGLFLVASAESFNIFSALMSSPWTAENFGGDPQKAASTRYYLVLSAAANTGLGFGASLLGGSWWPLVGTSVVTLFMAYIYNRALAKGMASGSMGWSNQ